MKNKIVLIFGGAGKLGIQFERILSSYGAKVYILDKKITKHKPNHYKCDVGNKKEVQFVFNKIIKKENKIDVIIQCVLKPDEYYKNFENYNLKTWNNVVHTNLTGAFSSFTISNQKIFKD